MQQNIRIDWMKEADLAAAASIEKMLFSDAWQENGFLETLQQKNALCMVAHLGELVVAYACVYVVLDDGELVKIGVHPKYQNNGIAQMLLLKITEEAKRIGASTMCLEVRKSNEPAKKLYEKQGFLMLGERRNFYEKPTEDACVMQKTFASES